jgi:hypothetical protein
MDVVSDKKIDKLVATQGMTRVYELEDGSWLTARGGTVAWRNNNPGNLKFGFKDSVDTPENRLPRTKEQALHSAQTNYKGVVALDQWGNAVFESYEAGREAQKSLLVHRMGDKTVDELVKSYSTKDYSGEAHHANQIKTIYSTAAAEGFDLHGKKVKEMSTDELNALADGVSKAESWKAGTVEKTPPLNEEQLRAALGPHAAAKEQPHSTKAAQTHAHAHALRQGDHNAAVGQLQQDLAALGVTSKDGHAIKPDQHFGQRTHEAVEAFQRAHDLKPDGVAGPATLAAMTQAKAATQAHTPNLLDAQHPAHGMYQQAYQCVARLDETQGRAPGAHTQMFAGSLTSAAVGAGMSQIDHVVLSDDASRGFAVQGALNSPFKQYASVNVMDAIQTPLDQSSQQAAAQMSVTPTAPPPSQNLTAQQQAAGPSL